jgi:hypothetical protein
VRCSLRLASGSRVLVEVIDVDGGRVRALADLDMAAGSHQIDWDLRDGRGRRVPAGVYWVTAVTAAGAEAHPLVVSR